MIDTNVLFEGLTKRGRASGLIIDVWLAGLFQPCVSNALSLHRELKEQAHLEGTSLNQYIVYSLTRQVTSAYTAYAHSEEQMIQREAQFTALRESLKEGSPEEIKDALAKREVVEPEPGLTAEMVQSLRERIEAAKQTTPT